MLLCKPYKIQPSSIVLSLSVYIFEAQCVSSDAQYMATKKSHCHVADQFILQGNMFVG